MPLTVPEPLANATRAIHDVGLAAWLGGAMYGKLALNPAGVGLIAVNAMLAQLSHSRPAKRRAFTRSSSSSNGSASPLWISSALATVVAAADEVRRQST